MNRYRFGNIEVISDIDISYELKILNQELSLNLSSDLPYHSVEIMKYTDKVKEEYKGMRRRVRNPITGFEVWEGENKILNASKDMVLVISENCYKIFYKNRKNLYGYIRAKVCEIIRNNYIKGSLFAIHGALIAKDKRYVLVVGSKGSGKTSSMLHALKKQWGIFTDELVLVDKNYKVSVLRRFPALDKEVIKEYFPEMMDKEVVTINNYMNNEEKVLLDLVSDKYLNINFNMINKVYILAMVDNKTVKDDYKKDILLKNWISGCGDINSELKDFKKLISISEITTIEEIKKLLV